MENLSASIVIYKNPAPVVAQAIHSFLSCTQDSILYLIDNSPDDRLKYLAHDPRIIYIFNNRNLGFGAGHNISLRQIVNCSKYHLILNPDVYFDELVVKTLYDYMEANPGIGQLMPKVLYPDGKLQYLCKLLPSPKTLFMRRFLRFLKKPLYMENYFYEFQFSGYDRIADAPFLSGCFMFLRTDALKSAGLFDESFFLYSEDIDLTRRIHKYYRTVYYPDVTIYHHHARGSYKSLWLLLVNTQSAIRYFNKWGWLKDDERKLFNHRALVQFSHSGRS